MIAAEKGHSSLRKRRKEESQVKPSTRDFLSQRMLEFLAALEKRGILEAATGAINDEATFSEIMTLFSSDEALTIVQNVKPLVKLLSIIDYNTLSKLAKALTIEKQAISGLTSLIQVLDALESRGLLEPIVGLLNDEKSFSSLAKFFSSDYLLTIINNLETLTRIASTFDPEVLSKLSKVFASLKTEVRPIKGALAVTRQLSDPAVAAGMGRLFEVLKALGEDAN